MLKLRNIQYNKAKGLLRRSGVADNIQQLMYVYYHCSAPCSPLSPLTLLRRNNSRACKAKATPNEKMTFDIQVIT